MKENEINEQLNKLSRLIFSECLKNEIIYGIFEFQPERSKREDHYIGGYFPPPWNIYEHPEKTEGWIAFQEAQRKDPKYYGCGTLNSMET
jgi:hypothetical protein